MKEIALMIMLLFSSMLFSQQIIDIQSFTDPKNEKDYQQKIIALTTADLFVRLMSKSALDLTRSESDYHGYSWYKAEKPSSETKDLLSGYYAISDYEYLIYDKYCDKFDIKAATIDDIEKQLKEKILSIADEATRCYLLESLENGTLLQEICFFMCIINEFSKYLDNVQSLNPEGLLFIKNVEKKYNSFIYLTARDYFVFRVKGKTKDEVMVVLIEELFRGK